MDIPPIHINLLPWFRRFGRHDLPWQIAKQPYTVWVSEVMLQQTQVGTVIPYYLKFIQEFPTVFKLAKAPLDRVLGLWSGLGYYSRARNLHKAANIITQKLAGEFPDTMESLVALPGIGKSTAAAILSLAMDKPAAILDGNVKRVLCRYHSLDIYPDDPKSQKSLFDLATYHLSSNHPAQYSQAIMDLGATVCSKTQPNCGLCPLSSNCLAYLQGKTKTIPLAKPIKRTPTKQFYYGIVISPSNGVLLIRRPEEGIWGGLWSFPEAGSLLDLHTILNEILPSSLTVQEHLPLMRHSFSHFRLSIYPIIFLYGGNHTPADCIWYTDTFNSKIGLAKPVSQILTHTLELI